MTAVEVDITPNGRRLKVVLPDFDKRMVAIMEKLPGARHQSGVNWTAPLDVPTCRDLRSRFGKELLIGPTLRDWATTHIREQDRIIAIAGASDWTLERVPLVLPELAAKARPYQRVGIAYTAAAAHPLNAMDTRLGKCMVTIGGIHEAGMEDGAHLVVAPSTSLETTWEKELWKWQDFPVWVAQGTKPNREKILELFQEHVDSGEPGWLVCNPKMLAYRSAFDLCERHDGTTISAALACDNCDICDAHFEDEPVDSLIRCEDCTVCPTHRKAPKVAELRKCEWCEEYYVSEYPFLHTHQWATNTIDECSKDGIRNPNTVTAKGMYDIKARKRIALSATPIGGRVINLWGILHYLDPIQFSAKWTWANRYLDIDEDEYGKSIGGLRPEKEGELYRNLAHIMFHRSKVDVRPELPKEDVETLKVDIHVDSHHANQYVTFAADAELRIDEEKLTATSILAEYTRLKQLASFPHKLRDGILIPQPAGAKYEHIVELLDERGMFDGSDRSVVIFSQFSMVVDMLTEALSKLVPAVKITGATNRRGARKQIQDEFQSGKWKVLCMTTTAGGVAIELDRADTCVMVDLTWDPDDTYQARSRISPIKFLTPKTTLILESMGTIEQYISETNLEKDGVTTAVLRGIRVK